MRYLKRFNESKSHDEINSICKEYNITNYTINDDDLIDVNGDVDLRNKGWIQINNLDKLEVFIDLGIDTSNPDWINKEKIDYIK